MEYACGNVYIRENRLGLGDKTIGHTHNFDHTTYCVAGKIRVRGTLPNGTVIETDIVAGRWCLIKAHVTHEIEALEPNTLYHCIYSHRDPQGDVVQEANGWMTSYT